MAAGRRLTTTTQFDRQVDQLVYFYTDRNGTNAYSKELVSEIFKAADRLLRMPDLGKSSHVEGVRYLVLLPSKHRLYYFYSEEELILIALWHGQMQEEKLRLLLP